MDIEQKNNSHEKRNLVITLFVIIGILLIGWYFFSYKKDIKQYSPEEKDRIIQESGLSNTSNMTKDEKNAILNSQNQIKNTMTPEEKEKIINSLQ